MTNIPKDTIHPPENESQQVVTALAGGLISYIRTEGSSVDSVKKNAPIPIAAESQAWSNCLRADLTWILDETNPLLGNKSLVFKSIAISIDLLEHLRSLISSSLDGSFSLPEDPKIKCLLLNYNRFT